MSKLFFTILFSAMFFSISLPFTHAEMSSANFILKATVMDTTGTTKGSANFDLLDSVGQPTPVGFSTSGSFNLESGFMYNTLQTSLDKVIPGVIGSMQELILDPTLSKQEKKKVEMAIQFLEDALAAWTLYEAGDPNALANALNKTKSAINKMIASGAGTTGYESQLALASQQAVTDEINSIAATATGGEANTNIIQSRVFLTDGSDELMGGIYDASVQSFVQAYNEALLAA